MTGPTKADSPQTHVVSFGHAMVVLAIISTLFALALPKDVLTRNPGLQAFVDFVARVLPAIKSLSMYSAVPEVCSLHYATLWSLLPVIIYLGFRFNVVRLRGEVPQHRGVVLGLGALLFWLLAFGVIYAFGCLSPHAGADGPSVRGGRGEVFVSLLTSSPWTMGPSSAVLFTAIATLISFSLFLSRHLLHARAHT